MLRIATWNINSVRLRIDQVARFVVESGTDVLCLQEIKCLEDQFPRGAFEAMGMPYLKIGGQKGWHGVAIASRKPITEAPVLDVCREKHARCVGVVVDGVEVQNFYIPAGGDVADRTLNPKFDHKMDFYERLTAEMAGRDKKRPLVLAGDACYAALMTLPIRGGRLAAVPLEFAWRLACPFVGADPSAAVDLLGAAVESPESAVDALVLSGFVAEGPAFSRLRRFASVC
jgi:hypothetical protein